MVPSCMTELLYTADAIREAVEAEREACASLIEPKNPRSDWTEYAEAKADCAAMIRARGCNMTPPFTSSILMERWH